MDAIEALAKEKAETGKRVATLKEQTKYELLRKEVTECEHELCVLAHPSILQLVVELFKKGGKGDGHKGTQEENCKAQSREGGRRRASGA